MGTHDVYIYKIGILIHDDIIVPETPNSIEPIFFFAARALTSNFWHPCKRPFKILPNFISKKSFKSYQSESPLIVLFNCHGLAPATPGA